MNIGFSIMSILFPIVFLAVLGFIVAMLIQSLRTWNKNNHSPRLTVEAKVVSKRSSTTHHHSGTDHMMSSTTTTYYVTFQVESGDRMELQVPGHQYGYMVEGDMGRLTFQGTRFLTFDRM